MATPGWRQAVFCEADRVPESAALFGAPGHRHRPELRRDDGPQRESPASRRAYRPAAASWHDDSGNRARNCGCRRAGGPTPPTG